MGTVAGQIAILLGTLFMLAGIAHTQPADSPWPVVNGNLRHTGLSPYNTSHVDGTVAWTFETGDGIESSPTIGRDGTIYVGSHDGKLYALNPDGTLKWSFQPGEPVYDEKWEHFSGIISSPALAGDGTAYIISPLDFLHAVGPDGKEKWRFPLKWNGVDFWASPGVGPDGTIYAGSARTEGTGSPLVSGFYAINPDGTEKWHYEITGGVPSSPAIAPDGTVYIGGNAGENTASGEWGTAGYLFAFAPDGALKWRFKTADWLESSPSIAADGTVYTGSKEGKIYAVKPDGRKKWEFQTGDGVSGTPAIGPDGTLYIGSWDHNFYALNPDGTEKWKYTVSAGFESLGASAAIGADGSIYFGSSTGSFYALYPDGTEKWQISGLGSVASSPAIGADGTVYIGAWDGKLYAIGGNANESATSGGAERGEWQVKEVCRDINLAVDARLPNDSVKNCIEGPCDSYATACQNRNFNGRCDASIQVCVSSGCSRYRAYCNLLIKNLDPASGGTFVFNQNYITADGATHLVKEMRFFLQPGQERSIAWHYDVNASEAGHCDYSDLRAQACEEKREWVSFPQEPEEIESPLPEPAAAVSLPNLSSLPNASSELEEATEEIPVAEESTPSASPPPPASSDLPLLPVLLALVIAAAILFFLRFLSAKKI